jgi:hypothetical protein
MDKENALELLKEEMDNDDVKFIFTQTDSNQS